MSLYCKICDRASDSYNAARSGDRLALAIENTMVYLSDEREEGRLDVDDDSKVLELVDFLADGYGFTANEIVG